jgi:hypothetical protein
MANALSREFFILRDHLVNKSMKQNPLKLLNEYFLVQIIITFILRANKQNKKMINLARRQK